MSGIGNAFDYLGTQLGAIPRAVRNQYVDLMGVNNPQQQLPYDVQMEQAKRQMALADALQKQSQDEIPIQSYKGIQAPIPWTAVLAKALQGAAGSYKRGQAEQQQQKAAAEGTANANRVADLLEKGKPGLISPHMDISGTLPQLPGGPTPQQGPTAQAPLQDLQGNSQPVYGNTPLTAEQQMAEVLKLGGSPQEQFIKQMYAPDLLANRRELEKRTYQEGREAVTPATAADKARFNIDPRTPAYKDAAGLIHPITDPNQLTEEQRRTLINQDRSYKLQLDELALRREELEKPTVGQPGSSLYDRKGNLIRTLPLDAAGKRALEDQARSDQSAVFRSDETIGELERLMKMPGFSDSVGGIKVPFYQGGVAGWTLPGTDRADFEAVLDTFKSKTFGVAIQQMKGMGALSDAEGKKIEASVAALDPKMSQEEFKNSAGKIWRDFTAARNRLPGAVNIPRQFAPKPPWERKPVAKRTDPTTGKVQVKYDDGSVEDAPS